jgi:hypothetical protein
LARPIALREPTPKIKASPTMMKATMAATLIIANQYSNSPRRFTCIELSPNSAAETSTTQIHCGTFGSQNEM